MNVWPPETWKEEDSGPMCGLRRNQGPNRLAGVSVGRGPAARAHVFAIAVCALNSFGLICNTQSFQGEHFLSHFTMTDWMLENLNILPEGS